MDTTTRPKLAKFPQLKKKKKANLNPSTLNGNDCNNRGSAAITGG